METKTHSKDMLGIRRSYTKDRLDDLSKNGGQSNKRTRDEEIILKSGSTPSDLFAQVGYASHNSSFTGLQKSIISELVDLFFSELHWYLKVIEEHYFRDLLQSWQDIRNTLSGQSDLGSISKDLLYFPALLLQTLAVSLQFLPPNTEASKTLQLKTLLDCDRLSHEYSKAGMEIMSLLGRHSSTITGVEHDLLKSGWLKNYSRGTEAWHLLGSAIRQAQDLGLHLQASIPKAAGEDVGIGLEKLWYDEYKRRLWVTLFTWDSHMSVMLGRPRSINASDCTIKTPLDCSFPIDPSKTIPTPASLQDPHSPPSTYSAQLFHYSLAQMIHELLAAGAHRPHIKDYSFITNLHNKIVSIVSALPPCLRPETPDKSWDMKEPRLPRQRLMIATSAHSFLMALHKPHAPIHPTSLTACIKAALDCLDAQDQFFKAMKPNQYRIYSLAFNTIDCGIVLSGIVLESPNLESNLKERIKHAIEKSIKRLRLMEERSPMAKSGLQILTICQERILDRDENVDGIAKSSQSLDQKDGSKSVAEEEDNAATQEVMDPAQVTNGFELPQPQPLITNGSSVNPIVGFNNIEMDTSFWEEMTQMIDFDIGVSMEEDLWNPNYSFPELNMNSDSVILPGVWYQGGG
ncbi:hypothetical protein BPOR_0313g00010 [Botrytis porri]|uniref:Xylanolytic transcriptional activator regulatory domain-containing protein n=1 Tax=Botrytis porri TaxID=87229 RepID=A0A4Z1KJR0_9HELO|nr:hypothetical protein BPOR_0313g00010 [Botrytis porri]